MAYVQALSEKLCNNGRGDVEVLERYTKQDPSAKEEVFAEADDGSLAIPVIDFQKLLDPQSSEEECAKLGSACLDWGLFKVINHGVPDVAIANLMKHVVGFFKQPLEAKKECARVGDSIRGYGQAFLTSEDQKLDWADMLYVNVHPKESRDKRFWPKRPATFSDAVDSYSTEVAKLEHLLLGFMAKGLGADPAVLQGVFQGQPHNMKMSYYPPCPQAADRVMGISPHSDANVMTLLLQANNDVQGLQVKKDGKWITVDPVDGAFIIIVGDFLEIMSNGKLTAAEHRVTIHPTKERVSVQLFFYPFPDMVLAPMAEFVKGDKERYRSTRYEDFMKQYFTAKLDGRKRIERMMSEQ